MKLSILHEEGPEAYGQKFVKSLGTNVVGNRLSAAMTSTANRFGSKMAQTSSKKADQARTAQKTPASLQGKNVDGVSLHNISRIPTGGGVPKTPRHRKYFGGQTFSY